MTTRDSRDENLILTIGSVRGHDNALRCAVGREDEEKRISRRQRWIGPHTRDSRLVAMAEFSHWIISSRLRSSAPLATPTPCRCSPPDSTPPLPRPLLPRAKIKPVFRTWYQFSLAHQRLHLPPRRLPFLFASIRPGASANRRASFVRINKFSPNGIRYSREAFSYAECLSVKFFARCFIDGELHGM